MKNNKIKVGISSCLLGENVRYDGGHQYNAHIVETLQKHCHFSSFCPEIDIGLGTPRAPIQLHWQNNTQLCLGVENPFINVTQQLQDCTNNQQNLHKQLSAYIFKKNSPSCGPKDVKVLRDGQIEFTGTGIFAKRLQENFPHLPVADEGMLTQPEALQNFMQRAVVYQRWQSLIGSNLNKTQLERFHQRHYLLIKSHDEMACQTLDHLLSNAVNKTVKDLAEHYISALMESLRKTARRENHFRVMTSLADRISTRSTQAEFQCIEKGLAQFRMGDCSQQTLLGLFKPYMDKESDLRYAQSYYLAPHALELLN